MKHAASDWLLAFAIDDPALPLSIGPVQGFGSYQGYLKAGRCPARSLELFLRNAAECSRHSRRTQPRASRRFRIAGTDATERISARP